MLINKIIIYSFLKYFSMILCGYIFKKGLENAFYYPDLRLGWLLVSCLSIIVGCIIIYIDLIDIKGAK